MKRVKREKTKKMIDEELRKAIEDMDFEGKLKSAALYTLMLPGKRLRPKFLLASAEDFGVENEVALKAAVALEMMHAASLIHDDLPAIDNDDYRRGKPSNHVMYGEDFAILAGDLLFARALDLCNEIGNSAVSKAFSRALVNLIDGEARDVYQSGKNVEADEILKMYERKTGELFAFAFSFGPRMVGKNTTEYEKAGYEFGVAFQIMDDVADLTATFDEIGKTPGKDEKADKKTLTSKMGLEDSKKYADTLYRRCLKRLQKSRRLFEEVKKMGDSVIEK